ncbi:LacI family transcriptional regulator [Paenibacillus sp. TRM 82003]|uniref:LacI family DNA-binding transcriptional regulator n=1 Tax=Kineococcus sp. TRM81007 TaxID=2925831 RepID=UPI001F589D92|nr:LacI family DNA-binding transcriptional regulator [Kineococcus sp. TRM81007]MCI2238074.1 LacI family transcriptional regulator [Kineococcus sp. TRM81007]MCI3920458.1 LacI family transcriptional regulator [Paenibacillus sp. TRM 82003]
MPQEPEPAPTVERTVRRRARRATAPGVVTLHDVATAAGVSLATASRVLNGSSRVVGEPLREKVLAAAARLDYSPNAQAQAMARGRSNIVGLVVHDIADPYFSTIAAGVMQRAAASDVIVTLAVTGSSPDTEVTHVAALRRQRVRALLLAGSRWQDEEATAALRDELNAFRAGGGRVAAISQDVLGVDTVLIDNHRAARRLAEELVGLGYREFVLLGGPRGVATAVDRASGFRAALTERGHPPVLDLECAFTRDGAHGALGEVLARGLPASGGRPPCVLAANDVMAVGAMAAVREAGLDVPRDVAVAGFDDIPTLRDVSPSLTTVRLPLAEIGGHAFDLVDETAPQRRVEHVTGRVLVRESTPPLR